MTDRDMFVIILAVACFFFMGFYTGKDSIAEDCETIKAFKYRDVSYECKVKQ